MNKNINPLTPEYFFEFLHIMTYIFVQIYYLSQFHEIGYKKKLSIMIQVLHWMKEKLVKYNNGLEALHSSSKIWVLERFKVNIAKRIIVTPTQSCVYNNYN